MNWTWGSVLFSDATRIYIFGKHRRKRVYGDSCIIWGAISEEVRTDPFFVGGMCRRRNRGSLIAALYIEEILADHVMP